MSAKYVFGPIASRRLGLSLGVDLVTRKTCTQDCPYCEAGWTTNLTLERKEYVPAAAVKAELRSVLDSGPEIDFITFSGAGEPTLNSKIGEIVDFIKDEYPQYSLCLLTNGSLLGDPDVAAEVSRVDLIIPNLDASSEEEFKKINAPAPGLTFNRFFSGLENFTNQFTGRIFLEIFIAPGINDSAASIERFVELIKRLKVEKVQLNTLDRPGCDATIIPAPAETVKRFVRAIEPVIPVEAVGSFRYKSPSLRGEMPKDELASAIVAMASRRQVTREDLLEALNVDSHTLEQTLKELLHLGVIESERGARGEFFGFFK